MADSAADGALDLDKLRQLGELMERHGLSEISYRKGNEQWRLRRGSSEGPVLGLPMPAAPPPAPLPATPSAPAKAAPPPAAAGGEGSGETLLDIRSPTVGTFYDSPAPGDPPFVTVGSRVTPTTIVCLIEAMKVFNQIPADVSGTIAAVLVKSGDPVEFGQVLFKVRP